MQTNNVFLSAVVFGSIAIEITGSGNSIFSNMMGSDSAQIVSPKL